MFEVKNIILPTDFSKLSFAAFSYACDMAKQYKAKIHITYVLEKTPPFLAMRSLDVSEEQVMKGMEEQAKIQLEEHAEKLRSQCTEEIIPILKKGVDYEEIVKYSKKLDGAIIIIATHGRTGILHTLLGSVAQKVIRYAKCPVLVITPTESDK